MTPSAHDSGTVRPPRPIALRNAPKRLPARWRQRLPAPEAYYRQRIPSLGALRRDGWAQGLCPFHEDHHPSLSVQLDHPRGGWVCFAGCGRGDLIAFHMRLTTLPFVDAVRDLVENAR
ncbi:MAG: hypothetical protein E6Q50_18015 [Lysobacter sp.]|nr:MAG: hypothetical protein E6Q50_18015 [Lysobacter sp.]